MIPEAKAILNDPACSDWLRSALVSALKRDPVDAVADAAVLGSVLRKHCEASFEAAAVASASADLAKLQAELWGECNGE